MANIQCLLLYAVNLIYMYMFWYALINFTIRPAAHEILYLSYMCVKSRFKHAYHSSMLECELWKLALVARVLVLIRNDLNDFVPFQAQTMLDQRCTALRYKCVTKNLIFLFLNQNMIIYYVVGTQETVTLSTHNIHCTSMLKLTYRFTLTNCVNLKTIGCINMDFFL